jgi:hypothetical protein
MNNSIPDVFSNLENLRLTQDFSGGAPVKKLLRTVPVRKPNKQEFVRVRPGEDWRISVHTISIKEHNETYVVVPTIASELLSETVSTVLFTTLNRQNVLSLWPDLTG